MASVDLIVPSQYQRGLRLKVQVELTEQLHVRCPAMRGSDTWFPLVITHDPGLPECPKHDSFRWDMDCKCDPRGRYVLAYKAKGVLVDAGLAQQVTYFKPFYILQSEGSKFMEPSVDWIVKKFQRWDVCSQDYDGQFSDELLAEEERVKTDFDARFERKAGDELKEVKDRYKRERRALGLI